MKDPTSIWQKYIRDSGIYYTFTTPEHKYLVTFIKFRSDRDNYWRMDFSTEKTGIEPTGEGIGAFVLKRIHSVMLDFLKYHSPNLLKIELVKLENKRKSLAVFGSQLPSLYQIQDGDETGMQANRVFSIVRSQNRR